MRKILFLIIILSACFFWPNFLFAGQELAEKIIYEISPLGSSEYQDHGLVDYRGARMHLVVFRTDVVGFKDTEKIYSDPVTNLPLWVERDVSWLFRKEHLTEEYIPSKKSLTIIKFVGGKNVAKYFFQGKGPIHNAILLPFSLRKIPKLAIGWSCDIRFPNEFKVKLVGIEDVNVPAGKFKAYHFTSTPHKFEIWISADKERIPVKIAGMGGLSYTLVMKQRIFQKK